MNESDRNPLRDSQGKGSKPRNCHTKKFRKNFDEIDWSKSKEVKKCDIECDGTKKDSFNSKD